MLNSKEERELPFELMDYFNMGPLKVRINFELGPTIDIRPLIVSMNRMMNSLANRRNQALEEEATAMDGYMISVLVKTIGWMRMKSTYSMTTLFFFLSNRTRKEPNYSQNETAPFLDCFFHCTSKGPIRTFAKSNFANCVFNIFIYPFQLK